MRSVVMGITLFAVFGGWPPGKTLAQTSSRTPAFASPSPLAPPSDIASSLTPEPRSASSRSRSSSRLSRLSRLPKMYGDSLQSGKIQINSGFICETNDYDDSGSEPECESEPTSGSVVVPSFGTLHIADNNSPIPTDRVYFSFQHFHNAIQSELALGSQLAPTASHDLNLFTIGLEKTFFDEMTSIDLRLPMVSTNAPGLGVNNPGAFEPGTLAGIGLILKAIAWQNDEMLFSGGLGMNFATGAAQTQVFTATESYRIDRDGTVFTPFFGFASALTERGFFQTFCQLNLPTVADTLTVTSESGSSTSSIMQQDTLTFNLSKGYWIWQEPSHPFLTAMAGTLELHYTTSLDKDAQAEATSPDDAFFAFGLQRYDTLNLTTGMLFQVRNATNVRIGVVAPLRTDVEDKMFDAEFQVSINHLY